VKYAIISDIHSNLEALEAARAEIARIAPDKVLNLGDLVGYGASPAECIAAARDLADVTIAGNHDFGVAGLADIRYFNSYARRAVLWTAGVLKQADIEYLRSLALTHVEDGALRLVHATPSDPAKWDYIFSREQAAEEFAAFPEPICFVGHSHQGGIFEMNERGLVTRGGDVATVVAGRKYLVNVGSIGQPRDGDPRASICVFDTAGGEIRLMRVEYDIDGAQRSILDAGLPPILAHRLSHGE
jgi:diadenosine tetraphosphatase ApaH/serine/threonine PP2A family protein phosphatase